jgi:hypothetical protein
MPPKEATLLKVVRRYNRVLTNKVPLKGRAISGFLYRSQNKPWKDNMSVKEKEFTLLLTMTIKKLMICWGYPSRSKMNGYTISGGGAMMTII